MPALVSCIVPVCNGEDFICETLESILNQTYPHIEIIVIDDGSTDQTAPAIKAFSNKVKYYYQTNAGPGIARNLGIEKASGEFIAFLDADDLWHPEKIEKQMKRFSVLPPVDLCFTHIRNFKHSGAGSKMEFDETSKSAPPFMLSSFVGRKSVIEKIGKFDPKLFRGEDGDFFLRFQKAGVPFEVLPEILTYHRVHGRSLTQGHALLQKEILIRKAKIAVENQKSEKVNPELVSKFENLFKAIRSTFQKAETVKNETLDYFYSIAGRTVKLHFANPALVPYITPALDHLRIDPVPNAGLTVCLWSADSTSASLPQGLTENELVLPKIRRGRNAAGYYAYFLSKPGILSAFSQKERTAFYFIQNAADFPANECATPLHRIFSWWGRTEGLKLIHAGAVGTKKAAVLLVGKGGSGKSSTALKCLDSELFYVSDDYCYVRTMPPFYVYSLYSSGKLRQTDADKYPNLAPAENRKFSTSEKKVFFLNPLFSHKIIPAIPIRAVFIPVIDKKKETILEAASAKDALIALAPSTLHQLPGSDSEDFQDLADLVKALPAYNLKIGSDSGKIVRAITEFLK